MVKVCSDLYPEQQLRWRFSCRGMRYISVLEQKPRKLGIKASCRHLVKTFFDRLYATFSQSIQRWMFRRDFDGSDSVPAHECLKHFTHETCAVIIDHCLWDSKRCERCSQFLNCCLGGT